MVWFFALLLAPDLSMIDYVLGPRVGAATYNAGHLYAWPVGLLAGGLAYQATTNDERGVELDRAHRARYGGGLRVEAGDRLQLHDPRTDWQDAPDEMSRPRLGTHRDALLFVDVLSRVPVNRSV
jgi:hypothetical protein